MIIKIKKDIVGFSRFNIHPYIFSLAEYNKNYLLHKVHFVQIVANNTFIYTRCSYTQRLSGKRTTESLWYGCCFIKNTDLKCPECFP